MKLLIIEDERTLSDSIVEFLVKEGHICEVAYDYDVAYEKIKLYEYDCCIVDINLPGGSGLDLIKLLKNDETKSGVIIISARNSVEDRIEGLEIGADNYLTKPFQLAELNALLKSVNRRINFDGSNKIVFNEIIVIVDEHRVFVNNNEVILTKKEFELLQFFIANKDRVLTKMGIAEHLWGDYMDANDSYDFIYTHIKNLRNKLLKAGCEDYIKTIYGVGYKFEMS